ncbi:MAG: ABC transporter permease [Ignavibacteria bacterium]|jgi:putative ABC transport system permease protein
MFKNYITVAFRNFGKNKTYSLINFMGLAIGFAAFIFILLWVNDELSYGRFHQKSDRIFRVTQKFITRGQVLHQTQTPAILAPTIMETSPEVEIAARLRGFTKPTVVKIGDKTFNESKHGMADENFFKLFSFKLLKGNSETALAGPNTAVVSESAALKYFGNEDPIGKIFTIYEDEYIVTGLYKDMPPNSHFHFDVLLSVASVPQYSEVHWGSNPLKTYVLLKEGVSPAYLHDKINDIIRTRMYGSEESYYKRQEAGYHTEMPIQKLTDIHLNSHLLWEFEANGNAIYVQFLTFVALFIIIIAIVNYVNLSTARSAGRAKEIGIRKSIGSTRSALIRQFIAESILTSFISLAFAVGLIYLFIPVFREIVGKHWLEFNLFDNPLIVILLIVFSVVIGIFAGLYPSFVLSSFKPVSVLRWHHSSTFKNAGLRNGLVVFQFVISIMLLVGTLIVNEQMNYIQSKNLGFNREQVLVINTFGEAGKKMDVLKEELKQNPAVIDVAASTSVPGTSFNNIGTRLEGTDRGIPTNIYGVDNDYLNVFKMQMAQGRFFSKDIPIDAQAVVINETMAAELDITEIGSNRLFIWAGNDKGTLPFRLIGIIKDFHYESFHEKIKPMEFIMIPGAADWNEYYLSIRLNTADIRESVDAIADTWEELLPGIPFEYTFMDNIYDDLYKNEKRTGDVFGLFTFFALFVSCLGLIGLTSFVIEMRTKEIGIRKVLGASVNGLVVKLSSEFTKWVVAANLIAWPLAYYMMNQWLDNFAHRIEIKLWMFLVAGLLAFLISVITVSVQSLKAAVRNPLDTLKYE